MGSQQEDDFAGLDEDMKKLLEPAPVSSDECEEQKKKKPEDAPKNALMDVGRGSSDMKYDLADDPKQKQIEHMADENPVKKIMAGQDSDHQVPDDMQKKAEDNSQQNHTSDDVDDMMAKKGDAKKKEKDGPAKLPASKRAKLGKGKSAEDLSPTEKGKKAAKKKSVEKDLLRLQPR